MTLDFNEESMRAVFDWLLEEVEQYVLQWPDDRSLVDKLFENGIFCWHMWDILVNINKSEQTGWMKPT